RVGSQGAMSPSAGDVSLPGQSGAISECLARLVLAGQGVANVDRSLKLDLPASRWIVAQAGILIAVTRSRLVLPLLSLCFATATADA
ncbi:MAG: hypothetical protein ACKOEY_12795, partial [Phenylobacterium sp.]